MANRSGDRTNQPPTGAGRRLSPQHGEPDKRDRRSEIAQAQRDHPELNIGDTEEETARTSNEPPNPGRPKAGR